MSTPHKNIVLICVDELIATGLGCMGNPVVKTPEIDSLARDGVLFREAHCCSPLCTPSRVSMFTGQYVSTHQRFFVDEASHIGPEVPTLVEHLKRAGYKTALIGKNHVFKPEFLEQWFDRVEEYLHWGKSLGDIRPSDKAVWDWRHSDSRPQFAKFAGDDQSCLLGEGLIEDPEPFPPEQCMTARIAEDMEDFLGGLGDEPFFLHYSFPDPHWPLVAPEPYHSMYSADQIDSLPGFHEIDWTTHPFKHFIQSKAADFDQYSEEERKRQLAVYYGMVTFIDDAIGRLRTALQKNGYAENTLILFTSDHGAFAGHYGLIGKTGGFYDCLTRIPLIMAGPGIASGGETNAQVSNVDFLPTLLQWLDMPIPEDVDGRSFHALLSDPGQPHRDEIFAEVGKPEPAPESFPWDEFDQVNARRTEQEGWFWFIDYTTKGRSAMIRRDGWKYCFNQGDREELYHLDEDPLELNNLAGEAAFADKQAKLKDRLLEWLLVEPHVNAWKSR